MLSLGLALGLSALAFLGFSPLSAAQAAYPAWSAHAAQIKRPQFRPLYHAQSQPIAARWRTQPAASAARATTIRAEKRRPPAASSERRAQQPLFSGARAGARKAVPVTRGQDLGMRFRPDEGESPYGQPAVPQDGQTPGGYQADQHSQFRPMRPKRKKTYEELQAQGAPTEPVPLPAPVMPYPMMPAPPLPGYGTPWPTW